MSIGLSVSLYSQVHVSGCMCNRFPFFVFHILCSGFAVKMLSKKPHNAARYTTGVLLWLNLQNQHEALKVEKNF